jgi:pimeloyl-ACP methyl ester carboxylesterase
MRRTVIGARRAMTAAALALLAMGVTSPGAWASDRDDVLARFSDRDDSDRDDVVRPGTDTRMPGFPDVIGEFVQIPGAHAPGTPAPLNRATFLRVRSALDNEPTHADAVVVAQPGFASTAGLWLNTAAAMVHNASQRTCRGDGDADRDDRHCRLEVWVVQRRSNLISDTLGLFLARAQKNPTVALDYYFGASILSFDPTRPGKFPLAPPDTLLGHSDAVFRPLQQADLPFEADWGYETYSADVTAMISLIKEESGAKNIFLGGHSQGGLFTSVYAGTLLPDGRRGQDQLAGLIYLDGGPTPPPGGNTATPAAIGQLLATVDALRAGKTPVFGAPLGNIILGPGTGAQNAVFGVFARKAPLAETIFPPAATFGLPFSPAGDAFLIKLRTTNQAWAGMTFDPSPIPFFAPPPVQTPIITRLGSHMGTLDFTPIPGAAPCDPLDPQHRTAAPCPPNADEVDPNKVYGWLDGGGKGPFPEPSNAEAYVNLSAFGPSRTNIRPTTVHYPVSGTRTIFGGEMTGLFWYQSVRYDADMQLLALFNQIVINQDNVNIDVNKNLISIPIYTAKGTLTPVIPGLPFDNPFPRVTDFTEINQKGVIQTPAAAALTPLNPAINSHLYNHSDFPTADDSLVGQVLPGQPGASIVADTVVDWIFARAHGRARVPSPAELGVVTIR